jgi:acyl-CoA thioester hydrolase
MADSPLLPPPRRPDPRRFEQARYSFVVQLQTRWGDMDALHHLNNAALTRYYEEARIRFMQHVSGAAAEHFRGLVGAVYVDYLRPALYPEPITAAVGVGTVGRSSLRLLQALFQGDGCVGVADVTLVHMGAGRQDVEPIPDEWRAILGDYLVSAATDDAGAASPHPSKP